uniref:Uncharacterized protein n=1 Tax=Gasterosteus aculeatus aculeatus TaxID=481459 RepID=A0AAQ4PYU2_GASAC
MAEGDNKSANMLAQETAQLEEQLQGWGEVILAGDRVVRWEKPWFPGAFLLLLPGLNQHGVISKYASMAKREINKLLKQKEKKNE